ncbi:hypothetical protein LEN26_011205 [Aphanomyces euteiches]|nr:hypothetical protein LEN26_011205 [Aphanomyces euteiches]
MPSAAYCPRCGDLLKDVDVCAKCQLHAVPSIVNSVALEVNTGGETTSLSPTAAATASTTANPLSPGASVRKLVKCGICTAPIVGANQTQRGAQVFHNTCLHCKHCRAPIQAEDSLMIQYKMAYHESCAAQCRLCDACHQIIVGRAGVERDNVWLHKKCLPSSQQPTVAVKEEAVAIHGIPQDQDVALDKQATAQQHEEDAVSIQAIALEPTIPQVNAVQAVAETTETSQVNLDEADHEVDELVQNSPDEPLEVKMPRQEECITADETQEIQDTESCAPVHPLPPEPEAAVSPTKACQNCSSCHHEILSDDNDAIVVAESFFHAQCFVCSTCTLPIADEFVETDRGKGGVLYDHPKCYLDAFGTRCGGCQDFVMGDAIQGGQDSVWHPQCFRCHDCATVLFDVFLQVEDAVVCQSCLFAQVMQSTVAEEARALHAFQATDDSQLSIARDDALTVWKIPLDMEWCIARDGSNRVGFVPVGYM